MRKALGPIFVISLLGLPGAGVFAYGVSQIVDLHRFFSRAQVAAGRVIALTPLRSDDDGSTYTLAVEYPVPGARNRRFTLTTGSPFYTVGERIEVLYTNDPLDARVRAINATWGTPMIMTVSGFLWAGFAAFIIVVVVRSMRGPATG